MKYSTFGSLAALAVGAQAHSWVEQAYVIGDNGQYTGAPGYMRGYKPRGPGFSDPLNVNLVPALQSGRTKLDPSDLMCKDTQKNAATQDPAFPKLKAGPNQYIALRSLENGHVTLPGNQKGKPAKAGTVMVFATSQPKDDEKLTDVIAWTADGSGGDGRGKLLTSQVFDDGRCYQVNGEAISQQRQQAFPNLPPGAAPGAQSAEVWCEADVQLPGDAKVGADLTLYWAWQWNTLPGQDPGQPDGKDEWYTSCMEVAVTDPGQIDAAFGPGQTPLQVQDPNTKALDGFKDRAASQVQPEGGLSKRVFDFVAKKARNVWA